MIKRMVKCILVLVLLTINVTYVIGDSKTTKKRYPATFDVTAKDYKGGKNYDPVMTSPRTDWNKPIPEEKDIKCPKCGGSGTIQVITGNNENTKTELKMCKSCGGKGTVGRTKKQ